MDVGEIRPVATEWLSDEPENRVTPLGLGWTGVGAPADPPAPPVAMVDSVATVSVLDTGVLAAPVPNALEEAGRRLTTVVARRPQDLWLLLELVLLVFAGLSVMHRLAAHGLASWVALAGALAAAVGTHDRLRPTADLDLLGAPRTIAVTFAAVGALSVVGLADHAALQAAAWITGVSVVLVTGVVLAARARRRPPRVVVVGDRAAISRAVMRWSDGSVHVIGGVLAEPEQSRLETIVGVPTIVGLGLTAEWAQARRADLVVVSPGPELRGPDVRHLGWALERSGVRLAVADLVSDAAPHRLQSRRLGATTVVEMAGSRRSALVRFGKGAVDRVVGSLLLLAASPFLGAMMLMIRLDSPGKPVFTQTRVGLDGAPFTIYKLRTMHTEAERQLATLRDQNEGAGVLFKMQDDPRITRVGRLLRRTSMDELPQLLNVVKGEMSLIGPRPALPEEVEQYDEVERRRLAVRPGMTGLWQVSGRSNLDWESSIGLDLDYVDNWRLRDDLRIAGRTVGAVTGARGAY